MMASLPSAAMPNCQPPASAGPVSGSVNAASTAWRIPSRTCSPLFQQAEVAQRRSNISQKLCYCETVKNITVSVPDDVYRNARVAAAQRDTSVSALVVAFLEQLSGRMDEFARLEALQREVQAGIGQFRAADRLSRDEAHDRAVR